MNISAILAKFATNIAFLSKWTDISPIIVHSSYIIKKKFLFQSKIEGCYNWKSKKSNRIKSL